MTSIRRSPPKKFWYSISKVQYSNAFADGIIYRQQEVNFFFILIVCLVGETELKKEWNFLLFKFSNLSVINVALKTILCAQNLNFVFKLLLLPRFKSQRAVYALTLGEEAIIQEPF